MKSPCFERGCQKFAKYEELPFNREEKKSSFSRRNWKRIKYQESKDILNKTISDKAEENHLQQRRKLVQNTSDTNRDFSSKLTHSSLVAQRDPSADRSSDFQFCWPGCARACFKSTFLFKLTVKSKRGRREEGGGRREEGGGEGREKGIKI